MVKNVFWCVAARVFQMVNLPDKQKNNNNKQKIKCDIFFYNLATQNMFLFVAYGVGLCIKQYLIINH